MTATLISMIKRRADLTRDGFINYYEKHHAPLGLRYAKNMCAYRRNYVRLQGKHAIDFGDAPFDYDVITESVFPNMETMVRDLTHCARPDIAAAFVNDEAQFIDRSKTRIFTVDTRDSFIPTHAPSDDNRGLVERAISCVVMGQWAAIAPLLHPDVLIYQPGCLPYAGEFHGIEGAAKFAAIFGASWQNIAVTCKFVIGGPEETRFAVMFHFCGCAKPSGERIDMDVHEVWDLRDGLIKEMRAFYFDTHKLVMLRGSPVKC